MRNRFEGKVAVITGSSRGIGKAIAIELAKQGAIIVLNGRDAERLSLVEEEIRGHGAQVSSVCCDIATHDAGNHLINHAIELHGKLDILINNVGVSMRGKVADLHPEVFSKVFSSNVFATVNTTIPALEYLRKSQGSVVFVSSLAGIRGLPFLSAYSSSKMALRAIAESIRIEEHEHKIHVGIVFVGMTEIEHNKETIAADGSMKILKDRHGRGVQSTEQVAKAVLKNIKSRKFVSTLTRLGKLNKFLQPRFPLLVEKIIIRSLSRFEEKSK